MTLEERMAALEARVTALEPEGVDTGTFRVYFTGLERMQLDGFAEICRARIANETATQNQILFHTMWRDTLAAGQTTRIKLTDQYAQDGLDIIANMPELSLITPEVVAYVKQGLLASERPG